MSVGNGKVYLLYYESMSHLATIIKDAHPDKVVLVNTTWGRFPDGFPNIHFDSDLIEEAKCGSSVCFLSSMADPKQIFEQLCAIYSLPKHHLPFIRVVLPWFSTGTMERIENFGDVASAKSLARMLSATPIGKTGPVTFTIYDIHALQEQFYFDDTVLVELQTAMPLLRNRLATLPDKDSITICFPDDGAHKRFKKYFHDYPLIICGKERDLHDPSVRVVKIKEGDANGRHCVVIDDLVQSGGTLIECAKGLQAGGASKTSCWVTHGIFPNEAWKKFTEGEGRSLITKFWITDSMPAVAATVNGQEPFEVLSLAPLIGKLITGDESGL